MAVVDTVAGQVVVGGEAMWSVMVEHNGEGMNMGGWDLQKWR
jgi:hypothetical protein